jgi:hypothetical protein
LILDDISTALKTIDERVYYGAVDRDKITDATTWDYIVFGRESLKPQQNTGYTEAFRVVVVRENYVPDGLAERVIEAMRAVNGFRPSGDVEYIYDRKGNTNIIVEMAVLEFSRPKKQVI